MRMVSKLKFIGIFIISLTLFLYLQSLITDFLGRDAYYHVKITEKMIENRSLVFSDFPWLSYTTLKDHFVDHHFLYHLVLIPFVSISPIIGVKIAQAIFASLATLVFYILLVKFRIKFAFFWSLVFLVSSSSFLYRMTLVRVPALSVVFLLLIIFTLFFKKNWLVSILGFFYVWLYGGFIFAAIFAFFYFVIHLIIKRKIARSSLYLILGMILGILFHPYLRNLFSFLKIQIFGTGPFASIPVGMEWDPFSGWHFVKGSFLAIAIFILGVVGVIILLIKRFRKIENKKRVEIFTLFLIALLFFILTLRSQRFIEYFSPFSLLFGSYVLNIFFKDLDFREIINNFRESFKKLFHPTFRIWFKNYWLLFFQTILYLITFSIFAIVGIHNVKDIASELKRTDQGYNEGSKKASEWILKNVKEGEIIFNVDWSDFPTLFFYNDKNYYISGLDPTFTYNFNKNIYEKWRQVTKGETDIFETVRNDFKSKYIVSNTKYKKLNKKIENDFRFEKMGDFGYTKLYKIED